ncbi:hypothetical protein [Streptomyces sp. CA-179760]|uniref:hypothetical protein n=1 Tax=Streptomyces sp. CA-179760 TaxID=3240054 RepID=UPI003D8D612E
MAELPVEEDEVTEDGRPRSRPELRQHHDPHLDAQLAVAAAKPLEALGDLALVARQEQPPYVDPAENRLPLSCEIPLPRLAAPEVPVERCADGVEVPVRAGSEGEQPAVVLAGTFHAALAEAFQQRVVTARLLLGKIPHEVGVQLRDSGVRAGQPDHVVGAEYRSVHSAEHFRSGAHPGRRVLLTLHHGSQPLVETHQHPHDHDRTAAQGHDRDPIAHTVSW